MSLSRGGQASERNPADSAEAVECGNRGLREHRTGERRPAGCGRISQPHGDDGEKRRALRPVCGRIINRWCMRSRNGNFPFIRRTRSNTAAAFEKVLRKYAADHGQKFHMLKKGKYPEFMMGTETYTAVRVLEKRKDDEKPSVKIVCEKKEPDQRNGQIAGKA